MVKKRVNLVDLKDAIDKAFEVCKEKGLMPEDTFVHICVVMQSTKIEVAVDGETVWIGGNSYLTSEEFELEE